ncbi:hypothetical protein PENSPDRAFT_546659, partial [Peniophora sp. CONT]
YSERPDFALHTTGGDIIHDLTTPSLQDQTFFSLIWDRDAGAYDLPWPGKGPLMAIHHETQPGHCWSFPGSSGHLGVSLAKRIFVEGVVIDHIPAHLTWDLTPAPRRMEVWGLLGSRADVQILTGSGLSGVAVRRQRSRFGDRVFLRLAHFEYDIHAPAAVQSFAVDSNIRALPISFDVVVLDVLDNWGNQNHTCLYRFRVHG